MTWLYVYVVVAAFIGGYFFGRSLDEAEDTGDRPGILSMILLSLIAPLILLVYLLLSGGTFLRDRA